MGVKLGTLLYIEYAMPGGANSVIGAYDGISDNYMYINSATTGIRHAFNLNSVHIIQYRTLTPGEVKLYERIAQEQQQE